MLAEKSQHDISEKQLDEVGNLLIDIENRMQSLPKHLLQIQYLSRFYQLRISYNVHKLNEIKSKSKYTLERYVREIRKNSELVLEMNVSQISIENIVMSHARISTSLRQYYSEYYLSLLQQAAIKQPNSVIILSIYAKELSNQHKPASEYITPTQRAIEIFEKNQDQYRTDIDDIITLAYESMGKYYFEQNDYEKALQYFKTALSYRSTNNLILAQHIAATQEEIKRSDTKLTPGDQTAATQELYLDSVPRDVVSNKVKQNWRSYLGYIFAAISIAALLIPLIRIVFNIRETNKLKRQYLELARGKLSKLTHGFFKSEWVNKNGNCFVLDIDPNNIFDCIEINFLNTENHKSTEELITVERITVDKDLLRETIIKACKRLYGKNAVTQDNQRLLVTIPSRPPINTKHICRFKIQELLLNASPERQAKQRLEMEKENQRIAELKAQQETEKINREIIALKTTMERTIESFQKDLCGFNTKASAAQRVVNGHNSSKSEDILRKTDGIILSVEKINNELNKILDEIKTNSRELAVWQQEHDKIESAIEHKRSRLTGLTKEVDELLKQHNKEVQEKLENEQQQKEQLDREIEDLKAQIKEIADRIEPQLGTYTESSMQQYHSTDSEQIKEQKDKIIALSNEIVRIAKMIQSSELFSSYYAQSFTSQQDKETWRSLLNRFQELEGSDNWPQLQRLNQQLQYELAQLNDLVAKQSRIENSQLEYELLTPKKEEEEKSEKKPTTSNSQSFFHEQRADINIAVHADIGDALRRYDEYVTQIQIKGKNDILPFHLLQKIYKYALSGAALDLFRMLVKWDQTSNISQTFRNILMHCHSDIQFGDILEFCRMLTKPQKTFNLEQFIEKINRNSVTEQDRNIFTQILNGLSQHKFYLNFANRRRELATIDYRTDLDTLFNDLIRIKNLPNQSVNDNDYNNALITIFTYIGERMQQLAKDSVDLYKSLHSQNEKFFDFCRKTVRDEVGHHEPEEAKKSPFYSEDVVKIREIEVWLPHIKDIYKSLALYLTPTPTHTLTH